MARRAKGSDPVGAGLEQYVQNLSSDLGKTARKSGLSGPWWVEVGWLAAIGVVYGSAFFSSRSPILSGVAAGTVVLGFLALPFARAAFVKSLRISRIRRQWMMAMRNAQFVYAPRIGKIELTLAGYKARVRVGGGVSFADIDQAQRRSRIEADMQVGEIRVEQDPNNARNGTLTFFRRDPLTSRSNDEAWPLRGEVIDEDDWPPPPRNGGSNGPGPGQGDGQQPSGPQFGTDVSVWGPIPIGRDEYGNPVSIIMPERHILVGGTTGAGKSNFLSMILGAAALDSATRIYLIDGKMVEFAAWEDCAVGFAHKIDDAVFLLKCVQSVMDDRYAELRRLGRRKVWQGGPMPLSFVFVDELALFTAALDKKASGEFTTVLTDIVARGRAAGIVVVAATQKPEGRVVDTNLRDLFAYRLALRCGTPDASDTILGRGYAARGFNAATIAMEHQGVGFLLAEGGVPIRHRGFHLTDDDVRSLATRARKGRACISSFT